MAAARRALVLALALAAGAAGAQQQAAAPAEAATDAAEVIVSHGISAFGDLKYPKGFAHFDYVDPDAPQGGTMSFRGTGASQTFDSLNPFILKGEAAQGLGLLYDSLLAGSADEPDAAYGLVAESLEYPPDRSWVIFNMRPEATFSDGHPITAEDVVFTWQVLLEKGTPSYQIILKDIESVEALDEHRVKFTFKAGSPKRDLPSLAGGLSILPKHYYETVDFGASTMTPPVGSGRFVVAAADPGKSIRYCKNPDYWGEDLPVNVGSYNFDCIVYEYFTDNNAAFEALKIGNYLFHQEFFAILWATAYDFPALEKGWVKREELDDETPSGAQGFWFNLRRPTFQDPRVREAIGLMFNFEWTNETLFYGLYQRTDSFFENSPMQAEGVPEGEELAVLEEFRDRLPPEIFTEPAWTPAVNGKSQTDRAAIRRASRLLDEAGWTVGADGKRRNAARRGADPALRRRQPGDGAGDQPLRRRTSAASASTPATPRSTPRRCSSARRTSTTTSCPARFAMSLSPSIELRQLFSSESADTPGSVNLSGIADPVVDALVEKVIQAETREEMEVRVRALDRVLRHMQIWVPNWYTGKYLVAYWDVFGKPEVKPPYARGDTTWWFDQAKYDKLEAEGALR